MINVSGLAKSFAGRLLFEDLSFTLSKNEVLGLVGRNGCGKSTLTKIILGIEDADEGNVSLPRGYRLGHLDQHIHFTEKTLLEETCKALPEGRELETYLAEKNLSGLGFNEKDFTKDPRTFSGGFQLRINLAKCLLREPDLLILDEPTNYLDILSIQWMKGVIKNYPGEVILITHDRSFMDSVVTHIAGIHRQSFKKIKGQTQKYYEQIAQEEEIHEKTRKNQVRKKQELEKFVEKFRAKASKASQAQSKMKILDKMEISNKLDDEAHLGFRFNYSQSPAKSFLKIDNLTFGFKPEDTLIKNLSFEVKKGDRIGIIGKNGRGKTSLLNLLYGSLELPHGTDYSQHPDTKINYYQQTNRKNLNPTLSVADEISLENPNLTLTQSRQICGAMMFPGDDANKKIKVLSGGEQSRVLLGKVIATSCNVLFLDEPTNHLDMESIAVLIDEVKSFPGPVVFVTHDEDFLKKTANKLVYFKNGQTEFFESGYKDFIKKIGWEEKQSTEKKPAKKQKFNTPLKKLRPLERDIEKLEEKIQNLEGKIKDNNSFLSGDWEKDQEVYAKISEDQKKVDRFYLDLENKMTQLEKLKSH